MADEQLLLPHTKRLRTLRFGIYAMLILALLAAASGPLVIAPSIARKLKAMVAAHLHAELTIGELTYRPPFTVHLYDVKLIADPETSGEELFAARRIDLSLASLPLGSGPLIIERLNLFAPTVHVIRKVDRQMVGGDLSRPSKAPKPPEASRLSDMLRLRHLSISQATIVYEDRSRPGSVATEWKGIGSDVELAPQSASKYGFQFTAQDKPIATADVAGTFDVDSLVMDVQHWTATIEPSSPQDADGVDPLPPIVRDWVQRYGLMGKLTFSGTASLPLKSVRNSHFTADVRVQNARASMHGSGAIDDLSLLLHMQRDAAANAATGDGPVRLRLESLTAVAGDARFQLKPVDAGFDPATSRWWISELAGTLDAPPGGRAPIGFAGHVNLHADAFSAVTLNTSPALADVTLHDVSLRVPGFASPISELSGNLRFLSHGARDGSLLLQAFTARYDTDRWQLQSATVPLQLMPQRVQVDNIHAVANLARPEPHYPGDFDRVLNLIQPSGAFVVQGTAVIDRIEHPTLGSDRKTSIEPNWELTVSTAAGAFLLSDRHIPVTDVKGELLSTRHAIQIKSAEGKMLGGEVRFSGDALLRDPLVYQAQLRVIDADAGQVGNTFHLNGKSGRSLEGQVDLDTKLFSRIEPSTHPASTATTNSAPHRPATSSTDRLIGDFCADGRLQIHNGQLWSLNVLQSLIGHTKIAQEALTAGEAAARFEIADRTIHLRHFAVNSPALGLSGSGTESFDGKLNLEVIAAPLGDWRKKIQETDIPILSDAFAAAAGQIQKVVNGATQQLLFQFKVTGTRDEPMVETIPAPLLTEGAAKLFSSMMHPGKGDKLIDQMGEK